MVIRTSEEYLEEKKRREREKVDKVNSCVDRLKNQGYGGVINATNLSDYCSANDISEVLDKRNDLKMVNKNQYKIIYENIGLNFEIKPNIAFYRTSMKFEGKKQLLEFLNNARKVHISEDMFFIPYKYKRDDKFYLLVVNNILENIEAYQLNSLNYLNKQHNVYYIIETNRDKKFKELNVFKNHVIQTCQQYTNYNKKLLYNVYNKVDNFKKDKTITKQYTK